MDPYGSHEFVITDFDLSNFEFFITEIYDEFVITDF
jgi:hypothetical protein